MKATGIVRHIDDLGRVVIPREIRRSLGIRKGMPMEIYTGYNGEVIFRPYRPNVADEIDAHREVLEDYLIDCDVPSDKRRAIMEQFSALVNKVKKIENKY